MTRLTIEELEAQVRRGVAEPHRVNNRYEYRDALAALTELAARAREAEEKLAAFREVLANVRSEGAVRAALDKRSTP